MSDRKIYSQDDLADFSIKYAKSIESKYKELNNDKDLVHPSEHEYKQISETIIDELVNEDRCVAIYLTGKKKDKRCQAAPRKGSKYCNKHQTRDTGNKKEPETLEEALKKIALLEKQIT